MVVDSSNLRHYKDDDTLTMKTIKGATTHFVAETIWGASCCHIRAYGMAFAAIGGAYMGVEQLLQNHRIKRHFVFFVQT
ncbi:hypothetical protein like AT2G42210 [Hibiscus trionum]|uniref:Uncharacterized protein n=1 Tax=Hibiscus trionum TaxID=183268 RepID=A0A9W7GRC1_HIBTR|nr:hypothetical protein like AT2G42210 [Hibiscus trionum]